jgi:hypothetical protein
VTQSIQTAAQVDFVISHLISGIMSTKLIKDDHQGTTWEVLIEKLLEIFESDCVNIEEVEALLNSYKSKPSDWQKYAKFDKYKYTRNLVHEGNGKFNLMLLCWGPGNLSTIHDHANAHCFVKVLDGGLREVLIFYMHGRQIMLRDLLTQKKLAKIVFTVYPSKTVFNLFHDLLKM